MAGEKNEGKLDVREWLRNMRASMLATVAYGKMDERLELKEAVSEALKHPVPRFANWTFCFGGMTFFLFVVQAVTGILLTMYYQASPDTAYESVKFIMNDVRYGWLIRSVHRWGAELMILMIFLHMGRVFFTGAYKHPRELNWIAGVFLLAITLLFGFTGYLLPWDQKAYWGTTVGTQMANNVPLVGNFIRRLLLGGDTVSGITITRFFSFHVIVLPMSITVFLMAHFAMIRKQGVSEPL